MSEAIIGIDVSKKELFITMIMNTKIHQITISNDCIGFKKFTKWLKSYEVTKVKACMEATGIYGISFADYLYEQQYFISVVNPFCISAFAKSKLSRQKTDKVDSMIIAEYASKNDLRPYIPKDPIMLKLKDLYRCLQNLKSQQQVIGNFYENKEHITKDVIKTYDKLLACLEKQVVNIEKKIDNLLEGN